jgi:hypothetical protein
MRLSLPGGALTRKSIADVTRRRLRTILVVLAACRRETGASRQSCYTDGYE